MKRESYGHVRAIDRSGTAGELFGFLCSSNPLSVCGCSSSASTSTHSSSCCAHIGTSKRGTYIMGTVSYLGRL